MCHCYEWCCKWSSINKNLKGLRKTTTTTAIITAASTIQGTEPAVARRCLPTPPDPCRPLAKFADYFHRLLLIAFVGIKPLNQLTAAWLYESEGPMRQTTDLSLYLWKTVIQIWVAQGVHSSGPDWGNVHQPYPQPVENFVSFWVCLVGQNSIQCVSGG